tara:strand:- start:146 stop:427 length:282 start_codon:yes stop_codon:yes gene_type:complete
MNKLFENWQNYLKEGEDKPKVICSCLCVDCIYNDKNKEDPHCIAETINLKHATNSEGKKICECLTYKTNGEKKEVDESAFSGPGPLAEPMKEQ